MLHRVLLVILVVMPTILRAQQKATVYDGSRYVLVDANFMRGAFGYTWFSIGDVDTLPARHGQGIDLRIEARLVSGVLKRKEGFVFADAFFLNTSMGRLTSEPLYYYRTPEDRFSVIVRTGYSFMAGYSAKRFGVLAGKSFDWSGAFVGGSDLPAEDIFIATGPWMARVELRPAFSKEFRLMLTGWDNFNDAKRHTGFRVDVPFLAEKRFFLSYEFTRIGGPVSYATFDNGVSAPGVFTQHMVGLRFGSIY